METEKEAEWRKAGKGTIMKIKKMLARVLSMVCICILFAGKALAAETVIYTDEFIAELKHNILYSDNPALVESSNRLLNEYIEQQVAKSERERLAEDQRSSRSVGATERLLSTETYRNYGMLCGDYLRAVAKGVTQTVSTTVKADFSAQSISKGLDIKIAAGVTISVSYSYSGPDENISMPGYSGYATHRIFFAVLNGSIIKSDYALIDTSGKVVSTYSRYTVGGADATYYSTLVQNNNSNKYIVMNYNGTRCQNFVTLSKFLEKLESAEVRSAFDF